MQKQNRARSKLDQLICG